MAKRTRKAQGVMDSLTESVPETDTPDADSASLSQAKRDAARARRVSLKELAAFLDRDRNTVTKWLDQGCPYVQKADRDLGRAWVLDVSEVVRWLENRAASATADKLGASENGLISKDEAERRTAIAKMTVAEKVAAETIAAVVPMSVVIDRVTADYTDVRARLMALPEAIAGRVEQRLADRVREVADEQVRNALKALRADKGLHPSEEE